MNCPACNAPGWLALPVEYRQEGETDATMVEYRTCLECKSTRGREVPRDWRLWLVCRNRGVFAARVYLHNLRTVDRRISL